MQNFRALGAPPPGPRASGGCGLRAWLDMILVLQVDFVLHRNRVPSNYCSIVQTQSSLPFLHQD